MFSTGLENVIRQCFLRCYVLQLTVCSELFANCGKPLKWRIDANTF